MKKLIFLLAFASAAPQAAGAQEANALRQGARIEVFPMKGKSQTGRLMLVRNDSLFYAPEGVSVRSISVQQAPSFAFVDVKSVRVSRGRNVLLGMLTKGLIGTAIGVGTGAIFGAATWNKSDRGDFFLSSRGSSAAAFGVLGGAGGLIVGTIYGAGHGNERWERVQLRGE